jgi:hypothetical protein
MSITIELKPEIEAVLAENAAADGRPVPEYVARLVENAVKVPVTRPQGRKNLVDLFAESPLYRLELDFSRNKSGSRPIDL